MTFFNKISRLSIAIAVTWLLMRQPFWRYALVALWTMAFAALLLPDQMMFFARHPALGLAIPFAAGFIGVYLWRSGIETVAACAVLAVLAVAVYRAMLEGW
jgi:hypothetical protein